MLSHCSKSWVIDKAVASNNSNNAFARIGDFIFSKPYKFNIIILKPFWVFLFYFVVREIRLDKVLNIFKIILLLLSTILSSLLFPIVLLFRNKTLIKIQHIQFAVFCSVLAFIIGNLLVETGERAFHGNFFWQNIMCSFILFFICALNLLKLVALNEFNWDKYKIEITTIALHFIFGILYLAKIFITTSYS